jgi:hypothetical protein
MENLFTKIVGTISLIVLATYFMIFSFGGFIPFVIGEYVMPILPFVVGGLTIVSGFLIYKESKSKKIIRINQSPQASGQ